jgi:hypothetical protein
MRPMTAAVMARALMMTAATPVRTARMPLEMEVRAMWT